MEDQKTIQNDVMDKIKLEGVLSMGYGAIPKAIMVDPDLPINSKSLYAYFCSFSGGNQNCVTISRNKILTDLNYSKNAHYSCLKPLIESGVLKAEQDTSGKILKANTYTLVTDVKKYKNQEEQSINDNISFLYSQLKTQGVRANGYGIMPKIIACSEKLSIKAKGLYAYISSFAGSGNTAFPCINHITYHLGITPTSYNKYLKELIAYNCISVVQRVEPNGVYGPNDYYINEFTDLETPDSRKKCLVFIKQPTPIKNGDTINGDTINGDTINGDTINGDTINGDTINLLENKEHINDSTSKNGDTINGDTINGNTINGDTINPYTIKSDTYNNSLNNNSLNKNSLSINQDRPTEFFDIKKKFLDGIDAEIYNPKNPMNEDFSEKEKENQKDVYMKIQGIGSLIAQTLSRPDEYITIGKNKIPMEEVYDRFMSLNLFHIEKVVFTLMKTPTEIKNPTQYLLTALFNAPNEDIFFRNK